MAIFDAMKKSKLLQRLSEHRWRNDAEFQEMVAELKQMEPTVNEVLWTLSEPSPMIRALGSDVVLAHPTAETAQLLWNELRGKNPHAERFILGLLLKLPDQVSFPLLARQLDAKEEQDRTRALNMLLQLPLERIAPTLCDLLDNEDTEIRRKVLEKLLQDMQIAARFQDRIARLVNDPDEDIRVRVFDLLARLRGPSSYEVVYHHFRNDDSLKIRERAIAHLCEWAAGPLSNRIRQDFMALMQEGDPELRQNAAKVLLSMPDATEMLRGFLREFRQSAGWMRDRALETLSAHRDKLIEPLATLLDSPEESVRIGSLMLAVIIQDSRLVESVIPLLADPVWWVRITAAELLGKMGDSRAVQPLLDALADDQLHWAAAAALGRIADPRALRSLATLLSEPATEVRLEVLDALATYNDPRVLSLLAKCVAIDPSLEVRERAARVHQKIVHAHRLETEVAAPRVTSLTDPAKLDRLGLLLVRTRDSGGSDLHVKVGSPPQVRMNGVLQQMDGEPPFTRDETQEMLLAVLNPRQLKQFEQQQQLDFCCVVPNVGRYRANVYLDRLGMGGVFRVIPNRIPTWEELGLPPVLKRIADLHQGLVVVSGSASCGKTTTLAAMVDLLNETRQDHIITLEDPIEFLHPFKKSLVNQREVLKHTQSFAAALRASLREDPDVIVVGEMRDNDTLSLALTAAGTGHLVIGTMHTTSAHKTVERLIESFPPGEQPQVRVSLSESLKAVVCQSLLPRADGPGRVAAFEILFHTGPLANLIRDNKTILIPSIMQTGRAQGMRTIDDSLRELLERKQISPETAYARAASKEEFEPFLSEEAREVIRQMKEVGLE